MLAFAGYLFVVRFLTTVGSIDLPLSNGGIGAADQFPFILAFGLYVMVVLGFVAGMFYERRKRAP